jgi:hypothetical protein
MRTLTRPNAAPGFSAVSRSSKENDAEGLLEVRLRVQAANPEYVERKLGTALYTHLRGAETIARFREGALARALTRYGDARAAGHPEAEVGGLGLLVLQRAGFTVEDLGALLYALDGDDPWQRLTSYRPRDLTGLYQRVLQREFDFERGFLLPSDEDVSEHPELNEAATRASFRLRDITRRRLRERLDFVATFWMAFGTIAKSTVHGFGMVSSEHLLTPPGGGGLSQYVPPNTPRPFAVALISHKVRGERQVNTEHHTVELTPTNIDLMARTGETALELYRVLTGIRLGAVQKGQLSVLPLAYIDELSESQRKDLEDALQ